jgi:hypothetical protein
MSAQITSRMALAIFMSSSLPQTLASADVKDG